MTRVRFRYYFARRTDFNVPFQTNRITKLSLTREKRIARLIPDDPALRFQFNLISRIISDNFPENDLQSFPRLVIVKRSKRFLRAEICTRSVFHPRGETENAECFTYRSTVSAPVGPTRGNAYRSPDKRDRLGRDARHARRAVAAHTDTTHTFVTPWSWLVPQPWLIAG